MTYPYRPNWPSNGYSYGDRVRKKSGSSWHGKVVGWYATDLTKLGWCVESEREPGSVQIYPEAALEDLGLTYHAVKPEHSKYWIIMEVCCGVERATHYIFDTRIEAENYIRYLINAKV